MNDQPRLASVPDEAMEAVERRNHWFRLAVELGQQDDFTALLAHERSAVLAETTAAVKAIKTGKGSEHFQNGRDMMREDVLLAIDSLTPGVEW